VDADPDTVGSEIAGLTVRRLDDLEELVRSHGIAIGVIATPAIVAQEICDRLVGAGVSSILNFAPVVLVVPDEVEVRKVDMSIELQILAFHEQRKLAPGEIREAVARELAAAVK
jgi:redox-sensing transcriptional repressor